jgi:hypothetical protein
MQQRMIVPMVRFGKYAQWQALRIEWRDSTSTSGWQSLDKIPSVDCITVGHFFHQDDSTITLVLSRVRGGEGADPNDINGSITIPKECITHIKQLVSKERG